MARSTCSRARRRLAPSPRSSCSPRTPSQLRAGRHGAAGAADRQRGAASTPGPAARRPAVVGGRAEARAVGGRGTGRCTTQRAPAAHLVGLDTRPGAPASSWSGRGAEGEGRGLVLRVRRVGGVGWGGWGGFGCNGSDGSGMSDRVAYGAVGPWGLDAGRCREQKRLAACGIGLWQKYEFVATVPFMIRKAILPVRYGGCYVGRYNR